MTAAPIALVFTLNGQEIELSVPANMLLIDLIRDRIGLKGTKRSCDMEVCGACTVMVDGELVSSCTTLAVDVDGRNVTTIEGLTPAGGLSRVQEAFARYGAVQCGFCTPGFVIATEQLLARNASPSDDEIRHHLRGNLCRCTGYVKIMEAVKSLVATSSHLQGSTMLTSREAETMA